MSVKKHLKTDIAMKKRLLFPLFLFMGSSVMAQEPPTSESREGGILVAYFSATGTTAETARRLAAATDADLFAITPEQPYTAADLDWHNARSRSSVEMKDPQSRPALAGTCKRMERYKVVFIGFPVWWDLAPTVVNTFIESHDLKGKTVIPFATSGGSSITNSVRMLQRSYPELDWRDGKLLNRSDEEALRRWVGSLGL